MIEQIDTNKLSTIEKIYEFILCLYIVIIPIVNSLKDMTVFGYGIHIWIILFLLAMTVVINLLTPFSNKSRIGYAMLVLGLFFLEMVLQWVRREPFEIGLVLLVFLYIAFLKIPKKMSLKKINMSFYLAAIIAAIYSMTYGIVLGEILRTATKVDGSISIVVILIIFWGKEPFNKTGGYELLKKIAMVSCFVVAGFGMSRSRLLILVVIVFLKLFLTIKNSFKTAKIKTQTLALLMVAIIMPFFVSQLEITQNLFDAISTRFEVGFESLGRDDEIKLGLKYFSESPIFGYGWGQILFTNHQNYISNYYNHSMYVAILARGGVVMGLAFLLSFVSIIKKAFKSRNFFCLISLAVFFALGYGNAGIFNYTICGMMISIALNLNNSDTILEEQYGHNIHTKGNS
ncbi:MAG: O-antigen ligase family protein [Firmicutes bacterium]|nr:O-antigen ligase family protein [Bacillota bacterium]